MLFIFPLNHLETPQIGFIFAYDKKITEVIKKQSFIQYSKTHSCYYIAYTATDYNLLKQLNIPIQVCASRDSVPSDILLSNKTISEPTVELKKSENDLTQASTSNASITITLNNQKLWIKISYRPTDIAFLRTLTGAYWNKYQKMWCVNANIENLVKLQTHFNHWGAETYVRLHEIILTTSEPKIVELYVTPEHKNKICVKLRGYGIDTDFVQKIADTCYEPEFKRWIITNDSIIISNIVAHYTAKGSKVINRMWQKNVQYHKDESSDSEKQIKLLSKFPVEYHKVLEQYTDTMSRRKNSWCTIGIYTSEVLKYAQYVGVERVPEADVNLINEYLTHLSGKNIAITSIHTAINAIKYYYQKVIFRQDLKIEQIVRPKNGFHLPNILSTEEINNVLKSVANTKHICILYMLYGCGVRLNELVSIKINDVWWDRNQLLVHGKGNKQRIVNLGPTLKSLIKQYFDEYKPQYWLFEGQDKIMQYSKRSVQKVVKNSVNKAGINKKVSPHTLRHCFATHLLDSGVQLPFIQALLGHKDIKTTMIYTHVTTQSLSSVISPLDNLQSSITQSP